MSAENAYGKKVKASPGFKGAVKDAIEAIAKATAPKSVTEIKPRTNLSIDDPDYARKRNNQTTDSNN